MMLLNCVSKSRTASVRSARNCESLGIDTVEAEDGFIVTGGKILGGQVHSHGDHRLAMAMAISGLASENPVMIEGAEIIQKFIP